MQDKGKTRAMTKHYDVITLFPKYLIRLPATYKALHLLSAWMKKGVGG
jgi:hypothetical protein